MHPAWWWLFPWIGLARMTEAYQTASEILREQAVDLHKLQLEAVGRRHASGVVSQEVSALRERVREVAAELSDSSVTFADPRVSYEEIQLTAGWRNEWLSRPEVVRALEEEPKP